MSFDEAENLVTGYYRLRQEGLDDAASIVLADLESRGIEVIEGEEGVRWSIKRVEGK